MMRVIFLLSFLVSFVSSFGQVYQIMPQYGYDVKRMNFDSTLQIPTVCGVPTIKSVQNLKKAAIAFDSCNNRFYQYNPSNATWSYLGGGGGSTPSLQQVTDVGNTITSGGETLTLTYNKMQIQSIGDFNAQFYYDQMQFISDNGSAVIHPIPTIGGHSYYLTDTAQIKTTDTIATLDDIRNNKIDTTGAFLISVSQPNDSTLTFQKGATTTSYTIRASVAGSATRLVTSVYNNSGSTIPKGSVIYINGRHSSNLPTIALAQANNEQNSYTTFALVENDITNNSSGIVIQAGNITNLNLPTSSYTDGQVLYLSPTVAGAYTTTKPLAPNHIVKLGTITRAHPTFGTIELKIENGWQLDELSDISIPAVPADSVVLQFSRVDSLWHDVSILNAVGNRYIKPSDTSVFDRKSAAAYTFRANGTNATANATDFTFRDTSGVYGGTITWTGTTAPSGATNHYYQWQQIGKMVKLQMVLSYANAGSAVSSVTMTLPSDCPSPALPAFNAGASSILYFGIGHVALNTTSTTAASVVSGLRRNSADNGNELFVSFATTGPRVARIEVTYRAQ